MQEYMCLDVNEGNAVHLYKYVYACIHVYTYAYMHMHSVCTCVLPLSVDSQRAIELNPHNATCRHLLGQWYKLINNNTIPNCMLSVYLIL